MTRVLMLAYAQYFNDARIKAYVHAWLDRGAEVDVFCLQDPPSPAPRPKGLRVIPLQPKYQGKSALRYVLEYGRFLWRARRAVSQVLRRNAYDVFHVHNMPDALVFCIPGRRRRRGRLILDMHDVMLAGVLSKFEGLKRWLFYGPVWLQSWLSVKWADALIHADHSQQALLQEYGIHHPRRLVYLNLPDSRWFHRRPPTPPHEPIRVVYHGSITTRSGLDLAAVAVAKVAPRLPMTLTLIGDGELRRPLEEQCRREGWLNRWIFFKDFMQVEDLQAEIEQYDIGIVANRRSLMSERCMLPVKLMEYLRIGLPVVAPDLPVIRHYFDERMIAYFRPDDPDDLARTLEALARAPDRWPAMIRASDEFFDTYSESRQREAYLALALGHADLTAKAP